MVCPPFLCRPVALVCPECLVMWAERRESQRTLGTCFRHKSSHCPGPSLRVSQSALRVALIRPPPTYYD